MICPRFLKLVWISCNIPSFSHPSKSLIFYLCIMVRVILVAISQYLQTFKAFMCVPLSYLLLCSFVFRLYSPPPDPWHQIFPFASAQERVEMVTTIHTAPTIMLQWCVQCIKGVVGVLQVYRGGAGSDSRNSTWIVGPYSTRSIPLAGAYSTGSLELSGVCYCSSNPISHALSPP